MEMVPANTMKKIYYANIYYISLINKHYSIFFICSFFFLINSFRPLSGIAIILNTHTFNLNTHLDKYPISVNNPTNISLSNRYPILIPIKNIRPDLNIITLLDTWFVSTIFFYFVDHYTYFLVQIHS